MIFVFLVATKTYDLWKAEKSDFVLVLVAMAG
jgi:hypothetical protein